MFSPVFWWETIVSFARNLRFCWFIQLPVKKVFPNHRFDFPSDRKRVVGWPPGSSSCQINNRKWRRFTWSATRGHTRCGWREWRRRGRKFPLWYTSAAWDFDTTDKVRLGVFVCAWPFKTVGPHQADSQVDCDEEPWFEALIDWERERELIGTVHPRGWSCQRGTGKSRGAQKLHCSCETTVETSWDTRCPQERQESGNISTRASLWDAPSVHLRSRDVFLSWWRDGKVIQSLSPLLQLHFPLVPVLQKAPSPWRNTHAGLIIGCFSWFRSLSVLAAELRELHLLLPRVLCWYNMIKGVAPSLFLVKVFK